MNEKLIVTFYHEYPEKRSVISYLSNYVRKVIRESDKTSEEKDLLLSWPIVYAHAWKNNGKICIYIGETNDLAQRIGQHAMVEQISDEDWHEDWLKAIEEGRAFSWFFASKEMNKSMCLDLEESLVVLLKQCNVDVKTKAVTRQTAYSNKKTRDALLKEIWEELAGKIGVISYAELALDSLSRYVSAYEECDGLKFRCIKPDQNGEFQKISLENNMFKGYPMVYLYLWLKDNRVFTYVGETEHFDIRNKQHLRKKEDAETWQNEWEEAVKNEKAYIFLINHRELNKSMTLDIENRLINYTTFIKTARNGRHNEQGKYSNKEKMFGIFEGILDNLLRWQENVKDKEFKVFLSLDTVRKQCVSLASPLYELTEEQMAVKEAILSKINAVLDSDNADHTLLVVHGGAGTGKTVLISALLFALIDAKASCKLVVNNKELAPAYQNMIDIWKLGCDTPAKGKDIVYYASDYLKESNQHDIVLIDEGHLLNTVANQRAIPQLDKITDKAKVTVLVFDPLQFIDRFKKWEGDFSSSKKIRESFVHYYESIGITDLSIDSYELIEQLRMRCASETQEWILKLAKKGAEIKPLPASSVEEREDGNVIAIKDKDGYFVAICKEPCCMLNYIRNKRATDKDSLMIATFDWKYDMKNPENPTIFLPSDKTASLSLCWHITGSGAREKDGSKKLNLDSWIKQAEVNEVGAVHDIQGFDLNYAVVIIGPSIQYSPRRGQDRHIESGIQVNPDKHKTNHDIQLILNELRVLLTRGSKGLIIYAVDKNLRNALYNALKGEG